MTHACSADDVASLSHQKVFKTHFWQQIWNLHLKLPPGTYYFCCWTQFWFCPYFAPMCTSFFEKTYLLCCPAAISWWSHIHSSMPETTSACFDLCYRSMIVGCDPATELSCYPIFILICLQTQIEWHCSGEAKECCLCNSLCPSGLYSIQSHWKTKKTMLHSWMGQIVRYIESVVFFISSLFSFELWHFLLQICVSLCVGISCKLPNIPML